MLDYGKEHGSVLSQLIIDISFGGFQVLFLSFYGITLGGMILLVTEDEGENDYVQILRGDFINTNFKCIFLLSNV